MLQRTRAKSVFLQVPSLRGICLCIALVLPAGLLAAAKTQAPKSESAQKPPQKKAKRLLALHTADAKEYTIYRDAQRREKLELREEPVYNWTNVIRSGGQTGSVFVWTYKGRPEVVGSIFSQPGDENRETG